MKTLFALCGLLLIITGCDSASSGTNAPQSFSAASEKGLAIGTITFEGDTPANDIYRFFYSPTSGDKKFTRRNSGKIMMKAGRENGRNFTGDFNDSKTYLFIIEADPGSYAFTQYNHLDHIGPMGTLTNSRKFAIPFEIKKGEIAYIGELNYKDKAEAGTPKIFVSGSFERDMAEFMRKFPGIDWSSTQNKTVKTGDKGNGMVEFL